MLNTEIQQKTSPRSEEDLDGSQGSKFLGEATILIHDRVATAQQNQPNANVKI